ncbi:cytochrome b/b6 domain-containing protein [Arthrobacter castelli]|uniref:cytochrome b/b6 domain-containing protein n=1 Tax=Arthrobacter castelli TaxID=271431 RepID=UPI00041B4526|nr:cytochrome b/b6 domain-containing protein [Arthrobacter castelli]
MKTSASKAGAGFRQSKWSKLVWIVPVVIVVAAAAVIASRWFLDSAAGQDFLSQYSGHSRAAEGTPAGFPWWLQWQHFFNLFLIVLIVRAGWMVRTQQTPEAYWTRTVGPRSRQNPPAKMSIYLWLHYSLGTLWILNGVVFYVLLFSTGHWKRVVPGGWEIFPNAISAGLQYLSLNWPMESAWNSYNALQLLAYFVTIFIAAPLAIITGIRLSSLWRNNWKINRFYPIEAARAVHLPVMFYFVLFIFVHVVLVFTTGMRRNLNYMFSSQGQDTVNWIGFWIFVVAAIIVVLGWIAARPLFMQSAAQLTGKVTRR